MATGGRPAYCVGTISWILLHPMNVLATVPDVLTLYKRLLSHLLRCALSPNHNTAALDPSPIPPPTMRHLGLDFKRGDYEILPQNLGRPKYISA
ncbi:hypothetical protein BC834DRAFT_657421 [Gloeopeniophorella convolvens]|nr:hypothetical protein BC834DRAFT_657421 [Gloeopeniophorella convolvens]